MAIECINTMEIRLIEAPNSSFAETAQIYVAGLQDASGCRDYTLTRSTQESDLWWLTGYWESESQMTDSFKSPPMLQMINYLIGAGASLCFASLASQSVVVLSD
ncbi:antibiotic biosynthesis monooxygenase family protein [Pseudomonas sp. CFBP 13719]|uniref:antibiotic biosynthesis monooxygenase family protein n=1 Tax=Pseudomonas sp. CFBP 13719 TaxID=2775303 RepID=UPI000F055F51|nr:antibiotic biosynthesis monooxygenase family protein [Pseudomonas sp. CFBP 13719]MBD8682490.1 antibiotic biosynthesis monooxygenase [Pseudomonas sp. CFBP 13719]